jgi:hypothetical protein
MKYLPLCLLAAFLAACSPFPKDENVDPPTPTPKLTPTPTPKPGAWMYEKKANSLDNKKVQSTQPINPLERKAAPAR